VLNGARGSLEDVACHGRNFHLLHHGARHLRDERPFHGDPTFYGCWDLGVSAKSHEDGDRTNDGARDGHHAPCLRDDGAHGTCHDDPHDGGPPPHDVDRDRGGHHAHDGSLFDGHDKNPFGGRDGNDHFGGRDESPFDVRYGNPSYARGENRGENPFDDALDESPSDARDENFFCCESDESSDDALDESFVESAESVENFVDYDAHAARLGA